MTNIEQIETENLRAENTNLKNLLKKYLEISDEFLDGNGHLNSLEMHTTEVKRVLKSA